MALSGLRGARLVLALALVALAFLWWQGGNALRPVGGKTVPLTQVLADAQQHDITTATLYDEDHRVKVVHVDGTVVVASYPKSDADIASLIDTMRRGGASTEIRSSSAPVA